MSEPALHVTPLIREQLEALADTLRTQLGDELVSLLVFGSAARGGWVEHRSDVDLVLVLKDPSREVLFSIANTLNVARNSLRFEAVILKADELHRAVDVFPLFYEDIKSCHYLLAGKKDAFESLEIAETHRRLRIEQELREMQIRLRRAVVDTQGAPERLAGLIERKLKQLRGPLCALLSLQAKPSANDHLGSVLDKASEVYAVDTQPLNSVKKAPEKALGALDELLSKAVHVVDQMEG